MNIKDICVEEEILEGFDLKTKEMDFVTFKTFDTEEDYEKFLKEEKEKYRKLGIETLAFLVDDEDSYEQEIYIMVTDSGFDVDLEDFFVGTSDLVGKIFNRELPEETVIFVQDGYHGILKEVLTNNPILQQKIFLNTVRLVACSITQPNDN